uniref:Major sperm protein n=1 Tax=Ditylenchus dipsaci TaxID=166011 RepID=A0A915DQN9_9BILA
MAQCSKEHKRGSGISGAMSASPLISTTPKDKDVPPPMSVALEPDMVWVNSSDKMCTTHEIRNLSECALAFLIKVTSPKLFRVHPNRGLIEPGKPVVLRITRLPAAPKSDRFSIEFLPYQEQYIPCNPDVKNNPRCEAAWMFCSDYSPMTKHIRFRQISPWQGVLQQFDSVQEVSPEIAEMCFKLKITREKKLFLKINELNALRECLGDD